MPIATFLMILGARMNILSIVKVKIHKVIEWSYSPPIMLTSASKKVNKILSMYSDLISAGVFLVSV